MSKKLPEKGSRYPEKWSPAKHLLREWRGFPGELRADRFVFIGDILNKMLPKLGLDGRIQEKEIQGAWKELVGDFIAKHAMPDRLINGTLMIRVIQASVRYELDRTWKLEIIRKLKERFGKKIVQDIKFIL